MKKCFPVLHLFLTISLFGQTGTWNLLSTPQQEYRALYFHDRNLGWIVATESGGLNVILKTTDGGNSWSSTRLGNPLYISDLNTIYFSDLDENLGWAAGFDDRIIKTTDGGVDWTRLTSEDSHKKWYKIQFLNSGVGYLVGTYDNGSTVHELVERTIDGGQSWVDVSGTNLKNERVFDGCFLNTDTGFIVGTGGLIRRTTDSGDFWENLQTDPLSGIENRSIGCINPTTVFVARIQAGSIVQTKSTDAGQSWLSIPDPSGRGLLAVSFLGNCGFGIANDTSGSNLVVFKTRTSGERWDRDTSCGGLMWDAGISPKIQIVDTTRAYFITSNRLYRWDGICTSVGSSKDDPFHYSLSQNYPNPFNPSTVIMYQLLARSHVTLKIYDLLGNEVETLVDQHQTPGQKFVQWNASSFASGIYFYRFHTGSFTETKKLLLVR